MFPAMKEYLANVGFIICNFAFSGFYAELDCLIFIDLITIICELTGTKPFLSVQSLPFVLRFYSPDLPIITKSIFYASSMRRK